MSKVISESHKKTTLMYHLVCAVRYRRNVLSEAVTDTIVNVCMEISEKSKNCEKFLKMSLFFKEIQVTLLQNVHTP